jgi:FMN reductase
VYGASEDWGTAGDGRSGGLASRIGRAGGELAGLMAGRRAVAEPTETVVPFEQQLAALRSA